MIGAMEIRNEPIVASEKASLHFQDGSSLRGITTKGTNVTLEATPTPIKKPNAIVYLSTCFAIGNLKVSKISPDSSIVMQRKNISGLTPTRPSRIVNDTKGVAWASRLEIKLSVTVKPTTPTAKMHSA